MGQQVLVNGHQINVYVEGDGLETIVVLSGAGIASPILDFKEVSESLSKQYKVVSWSGRDMVIVMIAIIQEM